MCAGSPVLRLPHPPGKEGAPSDWNMHAMHAHAVIYTCVSTYTSTSLAWHMHAWYMQAGICVLACMHDYMYVYLHCCVHGYMHFDMSIHMHACMQNYMHNYMHGV